MSSIILYDFELQNLQKNGHGQIRRVCKVQPPNDNYKLGRETSGKHEGKLFWYDDDFCCSEHFTCPFGAVREELIVKEMWRERWGMSYANCGCGSAYPVDEVREIGYKDGVSVYFAGLTLLCPDECIIKSDNDWSSWKSPVTMPREASRLTIIPERIWTEKLQDMTEQDAIECGFEGVRCHHHPFGNTVYGCTDCYNTGWLEPPTAEFVFEWDSHAKPGYKFADNPVVWCGEVMVK
jgi:hypothetical protein